MSRKTRKRGCRRLLVIVVLLALIVFGVFARGLLTSGKTTTERAQRELDTYAENNDVSLADYPDALVQLYARNPDARDFVRDYPKKKNLTPTIDLSGLAGSETVPLLLQWDERWGYREYNESVIGLAGCGPTCLSMVVCGLTGDTSVTPYAVAQYCEEQGWYTPGASSSSSSSWAVIMPRPAQPRPGVGPPASTQMTPQKPSVTISSRAKSFLRVRTRSRTVVMGLPPRRAEVESALGSQPICITL